ncbi:Similar to phosphoglycolate phosphatase, clustered with ribosomal large subunit pseudouridine synthase C [hydrothermal vent metagenome]|uniref:Similar to phosphoglycolate phosphatase, clustered with ribosomal large subunit pseudouridine synthase C n=1 Tax=hydrothermal vent metagenome TaxID=652676 RepID=A0A3B0SGS4_9ZZZZ
MSRPLRLIVFDVDGTLVDSQTDIITAMAHAFENAAQPTPPPAAILGIVGLSLDEAMFRLAPDLPAATRAKMVNWYKDAYMDLRLKTGAAQSSPLYPGARAALDALSAIPENILGVATGKSKRGLDKLLEAHDLTGFFTTLQVSDFHPSKPHPAMLHAALSETGIDARAAVMIGDTSFDMDMAAAAGLTGIGVSWGYHPVSALGAARHIIDDFTQLPGCLHEIYEAVQ